MDPLFRILGCNMMKFTYFDVLCLTGREVHADFVLRICQIDTKVGTEVNANIHMWFQIIRYFCVLLITLYATKINVLTAVLFTFLPGNVGKLPQEWATIRTSLCCPDR